MFVCVFLFVLLFCVCVGVLDSVRWCLSMVLPS